MSDRLMVKLIQINRLGPRIEGMLYRCSFDETWSLMEEGAKKLAVAGKALQEAVHFKELLSVGQLFKLRAIVLSSFACHPADLAHRKLHERYGHQRRCVWLPREQHQ